ncbi:MAG: MFS transporter [Proteobacteria bacterium]|nr:MFS transporter [Pseudomonadota bacterium]
MKHPIRNFAGALSGNFLEYYDVTLYGVLASFLAPVFFPTQSEFVSTLLTLGAFSITYLARPFGGMVFGFLGDRFGRKMALTLAVLLVTVPTFAIGLMPSYAQIGVLAPILVLTCRFLQGLCTGGEYPGVAVFISEHSAPSKRGFLCALVPASSLLGGFTGALVGAYFMQEGMPGRGWRVPFIVGGVLGLVAFTLRQQLSETKDFEELQATQSLYKYPLLETLKTQKRVILGSALIAAGAVAHYCMIIVWMVNFMPHPHITLTISEKLLLSSSLMAAIFMSMPLAGLLTDHFGPRRLMVWSAIALALISYPFFILASTAESILTLFFALATLAAISAGFAAPTVSFLTAQFPPRNRYSAMGFSVPLGEALGGATPPIASLIFQFSGSPLSPALYLCLISLIAILGIPLMKQDKVPT